MILACACSDDSTAADDADANQASEGESDDSSTTDGDGGGGGGGDGDGEPDETGGASEPDEPGDTGDTGEPGEPGAMIDLGAYMINATEVTVAQYIEFLESDFELAALPQTCSWKSDNVPGQWPSQLEGPANAPAARVDWCDAWAYCHWSGARLCGLVSGEPESLDDPGDDPHDNEWYRACTDAAELLYPYGDIFDETRCNGEQLGLEGVAPVGSLSGCEGGPPGLFDMSGNLYEWTAACGDEPDLEDSKQRCRRRGGSFASSSFALRCRTSSSRTRGHRGAEMGIRCCKTF